nr:hypothetical protein Itr_chr09CG13540 [Ipomoea trifida]
MPQYLSSDEPLPSPTPCDAGTAILQPLETRCVAFLPAVAIASTITSASLPATAQPTPPMEALVATSTGGVSPIHPVLHPTTSKSYVSSMPTRNHPRREEPAVPLWKQHLLKRQRQLLVWWILWRHPLLISRRGCSIVEVLQATMTESQVLWR